MTPRQERFVQEYLIDLNAAAAYRRAGYKATSDNAAAAHGARLVVNGKVAAAIQAAKQKVAERVEITTEYVLRGLKEEAERKGEGSSPSARVKALELLGKHRGMFPTKVQFEGTVRVIEDDSWYGNRAHDYAAARLAAPDPGIAGLLPVQGGSVRPALGQDGAGTARNGAGPRPEPGGPPGGH